MTEQTEIAQGISTSEPSEAAPLKAEEAASPVAEPSAPKEEFVSGKLGTLLRREQQFQQKTRAEKERLANERAQVQQEKQELQALKARFAKVKDDPIEGLKETGLSYDDLTKRILNSGTPEAKIEALQQKLEAFEQARMQEEQERQEQQAAAQIDSSKDQIKSHIFSNVEKYPTLNLYDAGRVREAAWDVALKYYAKTRQPPDMDELAEFLESQAAEELRVFDERRNKRTVVAPPPTGLSKGNLPKGSKTLTSAKASERATPYTSDYDKLSRDEQRRIDAEFLAKNLWKK